ncbi:MAG: relaxase/mobilization nuclease RlxS [Novosphingobium sp.]
MDDDDLEPRLGRMRSTPVRRGRSYMSEVMRATNLAGGLAGSASGKGGHGRHFHGNRSGVGAGVGRVLASRDRFAAYRQRRVVVISRIVRLDKTRGMNAARAHLRYIQRDGVTREGSPGELYAGDQDKIDGRAFLERAEGDRHQFRFIVSTEDGQHYDDLKALTRRLMTQMEQDLGTRLDWVAVDHFNTGHPHTHIIVRGKDERGHDLVIARDYISQGIRERAAELVSLDLGPRSDLEIEDRLRREMSQERLTTIDRRLLRDMDAAREVLSAAPDPFHQSLRAGRLQTLARLGLAEAVEPGRWRLAEGMDAALRRMGERGDIIRTMQRAFTAHGLERAPADYMIADPVRMTPLVGRIVERGLSDELNDRHYLIVDATDGRTHYVDIGRGDAIDTLPTGAIVEIAAKSTEARAVDRTIAEVAAGQGGRYSIDLHLRHDPAATETFAESHVRRLEAMRRAMGNIEREPDGTWVIAPDHVDRAAAFEAHRASAAPVSVEPLSLQPLSELARTDGATWLDREIVAGVAGGSGASLALRESGFGREVRDAIERRRLWLIEQDLAGEEQGRLVLRANLLANLRRRELARVGGQLSQQLGLRYVEAAQGERIEGTYRRAIDLSSGRFAVIEKSREFTLVPWRPVLDRHIDRPVSGMMRGDAISWTIGRQRSGPSIS